MIKTGKIILNITMNKDNSGKINLNKYIIKDINKYINIQKMTRMNL